MDRKWKMSVHASTKPTLPLSNRKPKTISSYQGRTLRVSKRVSEREGCEFPFKIEEERKNNESPILKRPNTVFGNSRRKSEWEGNDGSKEKNGKSCDRGTVGSANTASKNSKQINLRSASSSKAPNKTNKVASSQLPGSVSLLALAVNAQEQTIAAMRLLRSSLRKKAEEIQAKPKNDQEVVNPTAKPNLYLTPSACFFENSYASCLDEVFQAWVNLLYLITNLKITLNEVVEVPGTETFRPDLESEKTLISQAIECVKFFSQLKMRSLMESFEENNIIEDPEMHNFQILDFEKRISSSFFSEMETLSEKAKEMMDHIKIETPSDVN